MNQKRFWPDPTHALLLGVGLHRKQSAAIACWKQWKARVDLDDLDKSSFQIMSLVYLRLVELGIDDPDLGRIKGLHRYCWTRSQVSFRGKHELLKALHREKIPTMLINGAALGPTVYPEPAARSIDDAEILVPMAAAARAIELLEERGWVAQSFDPVRTISRSPASALAHPAHGAVNLHWRFPQSQCRPGREAEWWHAAQPFEYEQTPTHILCPADQFLHACELGMQSPFLQWLADCAFLIRNFRIDWVRLIEQSVKLQLSLHTRATLLYLREHIENSIPAKAITGFARAPVSLGGRIEYFLAGRPDDKQHDLTHKFGVAACRYLALKQGGRVRQFRQDVPRFLRLLSRQMRRRKEQSG